jgi:hypothetical protein
VAAAAALGVSTAGSGVTVTVLGVAVVASRAGALRAHATPNNTTTTIGRTIPMRSITA